MTPPVRLRYLPKWLLSPAFRRDVREVSARLRRAAEAARQSKADYEAALDAMTPDDVDEEIHEMGRPR